MTEVSSKSEREIVVEELLPHAPEVIWRTATDGEQINRWLMKCSGFRAVAGTRFTLHTTPAGEWDGAIDCEVLEVVPNQRLSYSWRGGHEVNAHYGSPLDTIVTFTPAAVPGGTRLRVVHSGFEMPKNAGAVKNLSEGWKTVLSRIGAFSRNEQKLTDLWKRKYRRKCDHQHAGGYDAGAQDWITRRMAGGATEAARGGEGAHPAWR